jgi:hypothetical protein
MSSAAGTVGLYRIRRSAIWSRAIGGMLGSSMGHRFEGPERQGLVKGKQVPRSANYRYQPGEGEVYQATYHLIGAEVVGGEGGGIGDEVKILGVSKPVVSRDRESVSGLRLPGRWFRAHQHASRSESKRILTGEFSSAN